MGMSAATHGHFAVVMGKITTVNAFMAMQVTGTLMCFGQTQGGHVRIGLPQGDQGKKNGNPQFVPKKFHRHGP